MKVYHIGTFVWLGTLTIVHGSMRCGCRNRGAGGRSSPPDFGTSVNLYISIRGGGQIMPATLCTTHPLVFSDLPTAL